VGLFQRSNASHDLTPWFSILKKRQWGHKKLYFTTRGISSPLARFSCGKWLIAARTVISRPLATVSNWIDELAPFPLLFCGIAGPIYLSILAIRRHQFCLAGQYMGRSSTSSAGRRSNEAYRVRCRGYTGTRANSDSIVPGAIIERQLAQPLVPWLHVTSDSNNFEVSAKLSQYFCSL
jgi:hypothetical protein